ncbi:methyltransferase [Paraphoma chrysanthemicola]|nr:methyltransferase [Paraphoma chrysanthemicola]
MATSLPNDLKARIKESYDATAEDYAARFTKADDPVRLGYLRRLVELIQDKETANLLELGCGAGIPATKFVLQHDKPTFHVIGNDISTAQLNLARANLDDYKDRIHLEEGDMLALSFPDSTFDAVTGFYSIIHLPREEQTQIMKKIFKWLKPGGLFLANFGAEEMPTLEQDRWLDHDKGWMFWSGWGGEASLKMVEDVGFEILLQERRQDEGDAEFMWVMAAKYGQISTTKPNHS